MFRVKRVKIIKCVNINNVNMIGKWIDVKEYKNEKIPYYYIIDTEYNSKYHLEKFGSKLFKKDCVTKQELRTKKLERIIKKATL